MSSGAFMRDLRAALRPHRDESSLQETICRLMMERDRAYRAFFAQPNGVFDFLFQSSSDGELIICPQGMPVDGIGSYIAAPVMVLGERWGFFIFGKEGPHDWSEGDVELVREVAGLAEDGLYRIGLERTLRQLEEDARKYSSVFHSIEKGFCILEVVKDGNGGIAELVFRDVNSAFERQTGLNGVIDKSLSETLPNLEQYWKDLIIQAYVTGKPVKGESYSAYLDRWYCTQYFQFGNDGSPYIVVVFEDITTRKKGEEALKESEARKGFLLELNEALGPLSDPEQIEAVACRLLGEHTGVNRVFYGHIADEQWMVIDHCYANGVDPVTGTFDLYQFGRTAAAAFKRGGRVIFADVSIDARFTGEERERLLAINAVAKASASLLKNDRLVGILAMHHASPRTWSAVEIALMEETVRTMGSAMERARTEQALRKREAQLAAVFDVSPVGLAVFDITGQIVMTNKEMRRYLPSGDELLQQGRLHHRWSAYYPDGKRVEREQYPTERALRGERAEPGLEMLYIPEDNRAVWTRVAAMPLLGENGEVTGAVTVVVDISELKQISDVLRQNEESKSFLLRLTDAVRTISDAAEIQEKAADYLGKCLGVSRAFYFEAEKEGERYVHIVVKDYFSIPEMPSFVGRYPQEVYGDFVYGRLSRGEVVSISNTQQFSELDEETRKAYRAIRVDAFVAVPLVKNGQYVGGFAVLNSLPREWSEHEIMLIRETAERVWSAVARVHAEVALRQSENSLRQKEERLTELLRLRDEFVGNATHELKTPLTSIIAYGQILQSRFENEEFNAQLMRRLNLQVHRLHGLISDLLDATRVDAGKLALVKSTFDLSELIRERAEEIQRITDRHELVLELEPVPAIFGDRERIGQVVTNLLSNAIKYTPDRGEICIRSVRSDQCIRVSIEDHGVGIPSDTTQKVFERFFRVNSPATQSQLGIGIGLYICAAIIREHGGEIGVDSELGKGSVFYFTVPFESGRGDG